MTLTGVVKNVDGLIACRFFLGLFELSVSKIMSRLSRDSSYNKPSTLKRSGFFPGAVCFISQWYPPHNVQFRMAIFYCASAASGCFSGLLAFAIAIAIAKMRGIGGLRRLALDFHIRGHSGHPHRVFLLLYAP